MDNVTVWAAFGAGIASFVTPCVLPMVPVYLASMAGPEVLEGEKTRATGRSCCMPSVSFWAWDWSSPAQGRWQGWQA